MATNKSADTSFRDLVARLNAMNNQTPDQERASLMEAAGKAPKVLDDKEVPKDHMNFDTPIQSSK